MKQKFIPGIYNYCDRWCERCTFTSRCENFEGTRNMSPEQLDMNNNAFWKGIASNFEEAIQLLKKVAKEQGIDLENALTEKEIENCKQREEEQKEFVSKHQLPSLCKQYQQIARPFLEQGENFKSQAMELVKSVELGIDSEENVMQTVTGIGDCLEVIQWYLFFIDAKLQRALRGKLEGESWEADNGYPKDSDGSAKIAIIAVDRSREAWVRLYELLPSSEDIALKSLGLLEQLRQHAIIEFPEALNFKRAGFDDGED